MSTPAGDAAPRSAPESDAEKSTRVDLAAAIRAEARSAYLSGIPDEHHPDL